MSFVNPRAMKWKFTYKEFSLLLGIVVALIIVLTLWLKPVSGESGSITKKFTPTVTIPTTKTFLKKVLVTIQDSLL
jgi:hypothetical protein